MRGRQGSYLLVLLAAVAMPSPALAQRDVRLDLVFANRHIWRGINRVTAWVGQVQGSGSLPVGPGGLGAGVSELREAFEAAEGNVTEVGRGRRGLGERNWWAEYRLPIGPTAISGGAVHYTYHGTADLRGRGRENNTTEVFAAVEVTRTHLSPMLAAYWDVDAARGLYLEASGRVPILGWPWPPEVFGYLDGALGFSAGLAADPDRPDDLSYYAGDGFTHAQVGLSVDVKRTSRVAFGGGVRFTRGFDGRAKRGADGRDRNLFVTLWAGATLGLGLPER
jgi:hypothetical protein